MMIIGCKDFGYLTVDVRAKEDTDIFKRCRAAVRCQRDACLMAKRLRKRVVIYRLPPNYLTI